jgi:hypothetical protein
MSHKVNIRPRVTVLSVLAHLEYKPWFALAEFVDNAIESFRVGKERIRQIDGPDATLRVAIEVDSATRTMRIKDNAAGISLEDFPRAFRPAELPPDRGGLSEFGMGMKSASCWFAPLWSVRTTALDEPTERTVTFDVEKIVHDQLEELEVTEREVDPNAHYTVIELVGVRAIPVGRTSGKIREHLTDIYRQFLRDGELDLVYRNDQLVYEEPAILEAPAYNVNNTPEGPARTWRKHIDFDFGNGLKVRGFGALRATGTTKYAGFSLFRRGRVIQGSADEKYRPAEIFGAPNSFASQRLFGELHLTGFDVSHTKDGFRWDESEEAFLGLLKEHLDSPELPLIRQSRNYREKAAQALGGDVPVRVVSATGSTLEKYGSPVIDASAREPFDTEPPPRSLDATPQVVSRDFVIAVDGLNWTVTLELSAADSVADWLTVSETGCVGERTIGVRLGLETSFMKSLVRLDDEEQLEPVVRLAAGLALAEHLARSAGVAQAGEVRRRLNKILSEALSKRQ